ncbi:hypothetical protein AAFJ72_03455 [Brevibacillus gelatini]|uniref:hypothetical protein n=1 Tax=Brevibacillus gelatini TaxID=1655277 RepID=UPI003D814B14
MKVIGILQILIGISGLIFGSMMVGDIGIAALIGAVTSLLSGTGFLLPENEPRKMEQKTKLGLTLSGVAALLLLVIGLAVSNGNDNTMSQETFLTEQQFDQLYTDAKSFKGYQIDFYGRVFQIPEKTERYQSFQVYAQDDNNKNTIIRLDDTTFDIQKGDILHIVGEVQDMVQGKNAFGAILRIPSIVAKKVEKTDYATAFAPAIRTIQVNQEQNQNGNVMSVTKVELAKQETRVHLKIKNESADTIDFHTYSSSLIQSDKQYERITNFHANYPEINSDNIRSGVTTEGVLVFQAIDLNGDNFTVIFEGSSDNWKVNIEPFMFEIPLKHEIPATKDKNASAELNQSKGKKTTDKLLSSVQLQDHDNSLSASETSKRALPSSLYGGRIPGIPSGIGDSTITLSDLNGEMEEEIDTGTGFAFVFSNAIYYTTSQLNINGNITEGEITAIRFVNGHSVLGITIGDLPESIIKKLGEPDYRGYDNLEGCYVIQYSMGDYNLDFFSADENSPTVYALYYSIL